MNSPSPTQSSPTQCAEAPRWQLPDTLLIVAGVLLFAALLTFLLPRGQFSVAQDAAGKTVVVPGTYQMADDGQASGVALFSGDDAPGVLNALFDGLSSGNKHGAAVGVIMFILVVGGSFGLILRTGAVDEGVRWLTDRLQQRAVLLLPVLTLLFSLGGAVFGMGEEAMAFAIFIVPLMRALGYDAIVAVCITYGATQVGFATSWMNPFSVAIAQGIAGLPALSGAGFRIAMWAAFTLVYLLWVLFYARASRTTVATEQLHIAHQFNRVHALVLLVLGAGIVWVIWGVTARGFYLREIATQFLAMGLLAALIARLGKLAGCDGNSLAEAFKSGASQLLPAALVVGLAQGVMILLGGSNPQQPSVVNTLLQSAADLVGDAPDWLAAQGMLLFQGSFNFFVSSGSAQAALTMPLMAPLADLVDVSRQTAIIAFQLGDGLSNLIYPTSAALMGTLAVAQVPFLHWLKTVWRLQLLLLLMSMATVAVAVLSGY